MRKRVPTPLGSLILSIVTMVMVLNHLSCTSVSAASKKQSALPNATVGIPYSYTIPPGNASWKLVAGGVPPGLALSGSVLAGTPKAVGQYAFTAQNSLGSGNRAASSTNTTASFSIAVLSPNQLSVTTTAFAGAIVGSPYSQSLSANGGTQPYSWFISAGTFVPGLSISVGSGTISGTPTSVGTYTFTVQAQDSSSPAQTATQNLSIVVAPGTQPLSITTTALPGGTVGTAYSASLAAAGGTTPYSWSIAAGQLPGGLSLNAATGTVAGTPTTAQSSSFTVQVQTSQGTLQTAQQLFSIAVNSSTGISTSAASFDAFGGWQQSSCNGGSTGHWYTEKVASRWWFCTPLGNHFFFEGVAGWTVPGDTSGLTSWAPNVSTKYGGSLNTAAVNVINKFTAGFNFNAVGEESPGSYIYPWYGACSGCRSLPGIQTIEVSTYATSNLNGYASAPTKNFMWGENGYFTAYRGAGCIDVFDPNYATFSNQFFASDSGVAAMKNSAYAVGMMIDDTDFVCGMGATPDFDTTPSGKHKAHLGYIALTTSPVQTFGNFTYANTPEVYSDTKVYSKAAMPSPPSTCTIATPCSLRDYLANKYGTIAALNAAWGGANYTSFDSTGTTMSETCGTGDGTKLVFNCTVSQALISPFSASVSIAGTLQAGDCPWFLANCSITATSATTPYNCSSAGQCLGAMIGGSGSTLQIGSQPWLSDNPCGVANANPNAPAASFWTVITYHGVVTTPSRQTGETCVATAGDNILAPTAQGGSNAGNPSGATGYDVYMACKLLNSSTPAFGCQGSGYSGTPLLTLQASNVPFGTNFVVPSTGLISGSNIPEPPSYIDYGTGGVQLTFASAPASGAAITLNYTSKGWMFGSGLMDEDGRNAAWIGNNPICLTARAGSVPGNNSYACDGVIEPVVNANQTLAADLDAWQAQYAGRYFSTQNSALKSFAPNLLYFGADTLGDWDGPPRSQILQGAAPYIDVLFWLWFGNQPNATVSQAKYVYASQYLGDKPMVNFLTLSATPDSPLAGTTQYLNAFYNTSQSARAQQYYTIVNNELTEPSYNGTYQWAGQVWWGSHDMNTSEINDWGLCTSGDNCYDGIEPVAGIVTCSAPTQSLSCGSQPAPASGASLPFGNLIGGSTGVAAANALWYK